MGKDGRSDKNKVRVRKSYYTFSKTYPRKTIDREGKSDGRGCSHRLLKSIVCVCLAVIIVCSAFFCVYIVDGIVSAKPVSIDTSKKMNETSHFSEGDLKAYTLSRDYVGDRTYIKNFIRHIRRHDATAVIVDFKDESGRLLYSSSSYLSAGNSDYDNDTVRRMIQQFRSRDIPVIASVCCFRDSFAAEANPAMAVKYGDTDVNWSDGSSYWLNPYSKDAKSYLNSIIDEIKDFGVDGFILKYASFPATGDTDNATFPGEKTAMNRNSVLKSFVSRIRDFSSFTAISIPATIALNEKADPFCGSLSDVCENVVFDHIEETEAYLVDKDEEYASVLSLFASLFHLEESKSIFTLPEDDVSNRLVKTLRSAGYRSIIIDTEK